MLGLKILTYRGGFLPHPGPPLKGRENNDIFLCEGVPPDLYPPLPFGPPPYFRGPAVPKPQQRGFTPLNPQDMACILFGVLGAFGP